MNEETNVKLPKELVCVMSARTEKLLKVLIEHDAPSYSMLSAACGIDVQSPEGRNHLSSARRIVERENKRLFDCIPNQGLQLVDHADKFCAWHQMQWKRLRHRAGRVVRGLSCITHEILTTFTPEQGTLHNIRLAGWKALQKLQSQKADKYLTDAYHASNGELDFGKTVDALKRLADKAKTNGDESGN